MLLMERVVKTRTRASRREMVNTYIVVASIFIAILVHQMLFAMSIPAEAALALETGMQVVQGKVPYLDFMVVLSPGLIYLHALPAAISKILPFHPVLVFNLSVTLLAACSCVLTASILFGQNTREQAHVPLFVICFALLNLVAIKELGQRDHLFLLLYIPFFLCRWLSWNNQPAGNRLSVTSGISGGLAIVLDPLFALAAFAMELFFLLSKLKLRPFAAREMVAALVVSGVFSCHFLFFSPQYAHLYFNWALPMVLWDYHLFDERLWWVGKTPDLRRLVYFMVIATVLALGLRRRCALIPPCVALSIIGFGLFVIQGRSLTYQSLLMAYGAALAMALVVSIAINGLIKARNLKADKLSAVLVAIVCLSGLGCHIFLFTRDIGRFPIYDMAQLGYFGNTYDNDQSVFRSMLERETKVGDPVIVLNDRVRPAYPLIVQHNRKPGSYLLTAFPLRMSRLMIDHDRPKADFYSGLQFQMYERLIDEIKAKPKLIMIENDSLGGVLKDHRVFEEIDKHYVESGWAEFPDTEADQTLEYYGFRNALTVYTLKPEENRTD